MRRQIDSWVGKRRLPLLLALSVGAVGLACATPEAGRNVGGGVGTAGAADPRHATYRVEGQPVHLIDGRAEEPGVPDSATRARTAVFGEPTYGDLDGDGIDDAALFLAHDPGGSGTFYYVAAALHADAGYRGTNAVLLGDRVAPQMIGARNGVLIASYLARLPGEPLAAAPAVGTVMYLVLQDGELVAAGTAEAGVPSGEVVQEGWLTIGHEVRSFEPCGERQALWIPGDAPALAELQAAYRRALPGSAPYAPLFAVVAGRYGVQPAEGFGAQYDGAFWASRLIQVWPKGNCRSQYLVLDEPSPGQTVSSPLTVRGRARGPWFFEGDFPMELQDARGEPVARHYATAQGEWMTGDFVPFAGRLEFPKSEGPRRGTLVLRKDNPSGNRALDDAVEIPVVYR